MYQPKLDKTHKYKDSQGTHIVSPAKLIILDTWNTGRKVWNDLGKLERDIGGTPILISETEKIELLDYVYDNKTGNVFQWKENQHNIDYERFSKILVLSEQLSDKHLKDIIDGKMGGGVLVKCTYNDLVKGESIYVDQQNHITIFPDKPRCQHCESTEFRSYHIQNYSGVSTRITECDECGEIMDDSPKKSRDELVEELRETFLEDHDGRLQERGLGDFTNEYVYWLEDLIFDKNNK